ncbi:MAG: HAMP domain-containing histidine kinase [Clostridia bacterium]|nr:HAMP domain-containing histidine kinase [Clostridia bacterium]
MKKRYLILFIILTFLVEIFIATIYINKKVEYTNDIIKINELVKQITINYNNYSKYPEFYDYTILDNDGNLIYKTKNDVSQSLNEAYKNRDTIIDLIIENEVKGKIIINNNFEETVNSNKYKFIIILIFITGIQLFSILIYYLYLYKKIIKPFKKMEEFATRISVGNLDIPLSMDRNNNFGAFTEAFDVMRHEIKKSRTAEKKAIEDKKELVAKLSHDIRTPIATIKSSSELGIAVSSNENTKKYFETINQKSDQINILITNLFNTTLEELEELTINAIEINSSIINDLINNADYLEKNNNFNIPNCKVFADKLRLQQVFDNIFINSYKYANTKMETQAYIENEYLVISIKDFGNSVVDEEIPLLKDKFKRGKNINDIEGTGLGLYISNELLRKMNGNLEIENANPGFKVIIYLRII